MSALDFQRRQPAVAVAPGVDALEIAEIENGAGLLRGVAHNRSLAGIVRAGRPYLHRVPEKRLRRLGRKRQVGEVVAVNVKVTFRLVEQPAAAQKLDVRRQNVFGPLGIVRSQRRVAAKQEPIDVPLLPTVVDLQQHVVVVAQQRDQAALPPQVDQPLDRSTAVGAAVHVVAQCNDRVVRLRPNRRQQGFESGQAAVDVADGKGARRGQNQESSELYGRMAAGTRRVRATLAMREKPL